MKSLKQDYSYSRKLNDELLARQRANTSYSLRAFARDLKIHPSTLSQVLNGKRKLPLKNLQKITQALELSPIEATLFCESLTKEKTKLDQISISAELFERRMIDETHYNIISEWEYYAVLSLVETEDFQNSFEYIAMKLKISPSRAKQVVENLVEAGMLDTTGAAFKLTQNSLRTTEDVASSALKKSHKETLDLGKIKLDEVELMLRDFSSMTLAVDPNKISEAKTIIREFRQKMATLLRDGQKREVYQLAIQLYPLT